MLASLNPQPQLSSRNIAVQSGFQQSKLQADSPASQEGLTLLSGQLQQESFSFSLDQQQETYASVGSPGGLGLLKSFEDLSPAEQKEAREVMVQLNREARLFARNEEGRLQRIAPATARELLESGQPIEVVTRVGSQSSGAGRSSSSESRHQGFFTSEYGTSRASTRSQSEQVKYTSSPVSQWDSVLWFQGDEGRGVPGTPTLPASGSMVTISSEWETKWSERTGTNSGIFRHSTTLDSRDGYRTIRETAEG